MAERAAPLANEARRAQQLRQLTEVSRALTSATTCDEVLALAVLTSQQMFWAQAAMTVMADADRTILLRSPMGAAGRPLERQSYAGQDLMSFDLSTQLGCHAHQRTLAVPLVVGGAVIGLLAIVPGVQSHNSDEEEWLLSALADQVAVAVEKMRLDQVAAFRERLIGIVSHDLRNPITAVLLAADRLATLPSLEAKGRALVGRIRNSALRAERMVGDLLDFTQVRVGDGLRMCKRPGDLATIVKAAVDELAGSLPPGRLQWQAHGVTRGVFDPDRLAQMVGNLLANALAYSSPDQPVQLQLRGEAHQLVLNVHNWGTPIAAQSLAQIFEPMHQATGQVRRPGSGLGLGLFICRHIVAAHDGTIDVRSSEARGTSFRVCLPHRRQGADARVDGDLPGGN